MQISCIEASKKLTCLYTLSSSYLFTFDLKYPIIEINYVYFTKILIPSVLRVGSSGWWQVGQL